MYVSGRTRAKGEINGKSANLNNCLKTVVYKDLAARPAEIPKEEVGCLLHSCMRPNLELSDLHAANRDKDGHASGDKCLLQALCGKQVTRASWRRAR